MLLDVGDEAIVEDPGYPGIRASLAGHGAQVCPAAVDDQGLDIASAAANWPGARLAVVTPTHQFPLGVHMGLARRLALIDWARQHRAWIVEDDYDGEFQYSTHRTPALCSLPHGGRVLYIGTFSKSLHPGLRLGFLVLPEALVPAFASAKALCDRHSPGDAQAVLARFIAEGHMLRHLRRMRELYRARQGVLIGALAAASGGAVQLAPCLHGMHLALEAPAGTDDAAVSLAAEARGVLLAPLSRYTVAARRRGWLLGYAAYDAAALQAAAQAIGPLLRAALGSVHPPQFGARCALTGDSACRKLPRTDWRPPGATGPTGDNPMRTLPPISRCLAAGLLAGSALSGAVAAPPATEVYGPGEWYFDEPKVFGPDSVLELQITGIGGGPCVRCSPILVFKQGVQFDGTLRVVMEPSWFIYASQFYVLFSFWSARPEGQFSQVELPALTGDLSWKISDLYINGMIQAQSPLAVPEPATWALWLGGLGVVAGLARRRVRTA